MKNPIYAALLIAATVATGLANAGDLQLNDAVKQKITAILEAKGYQVGKIKIEDGLYEAYAKKDGTRSEVLLNEELEIVKVK